MDRKQGWGAEREGGQQCANPPWANSGLWGRGVGGTVPSWVRRHPTGGGGQPGSLVCGCSGAVGGSSPALPSSALCSGCSLLGPGLWLWLGFWGRGSQEGSRQAVGREQAGVPRIRADRAVSSLATCGASVVAVGREGKEKGRMDGTREGAVLPPQSNFPTTQHSIRCRIMLRKHW